MPRIPRVIPVLITALLFSGVGSGTPATPVLAQSFRIEEPSSTTCSGEPLGTWSLISDDGAPTARWQHTATWIGTEVLVWGGLYPRFGPTIRDQDVRRDGARYDPRQDTWQPISNLDAPAARFDHTALWTGTELLVWGGQAAPVGGAYHYLRDGGRYDPATDQWRPIAEEGAPSARYDYASVWTGSELIVWGGRTSGISSLTDGARYNPTTDTWSPLSELEFPVGNDGLVAAWTGSEVLLWGGSLGSRSPVGAGAKWEPLTDTWMPMSGRSAPGGGQQLGAWTGTQLLVWGGISISVPTGGDFRAGGRYDPVLDRWTEITTEGSLPFAESAATTWTGHEFIIWGGSRVMPASRSVAATDRGAAYDPSIDRWRELPQTVELTARSAAQAVWTGQELLVLGGLERPFPGTYPQAPLVWGVRYFPPC
jgi:N-acetylneuraminic acid mutarotase